MPTIPRAIQQFRADWQRRHDSPPTLDSETLALQGFCAASDPPLARSSSREVDRFLDAPQPQGLSPATINRRGYVLKHVFDVRNDPQRVGATPVTPSHVLRRRRALPRALATAQLEPLLAQLQHPMDTALFLRMWRGGWRVAEGAQLQRKDSDGSQQAGLVEQGTGRKDRRVSRSADAVTRLRECLKPRPSVVPGAAVFWHQTRPSRTLSVTARQKNMARDAKAAGIVASGQSLRHTFASNVLAHGAELVASREWLGPASITASERYAKASNHQVKQESRRTRNKSPPAESGLRGTRPEVP